MDDMEKETASPKEINSGGIPNSKTIPWKQFCSETCMAEDPKAIAVAEEKFHFLAEFFHQVSQIA